MSWATFPWHNSPGLHFPWQKLFAWSPVKARPGLVNILLYSCQSVLVNLHYRTACTGWCTLRRIQYHVLYSYTALVVYRTYSRENGDLNQTFEKQNMQFKRTWVEYHYCKILKNAGLLYFVKMSSMFEICSEFLWEAQSRDSSVHCSISFSALSRLRLP